jgi:hypothetical protein
MSYKKSIFSISPAVEVAYDLHLSAALMRACVSDGRSERSLLWDAKEFRSKLQEDHNAGWKDGFSLRKIMEDKALRAPFTTSQRKGVVDELAKARHVPISVNLALVTDFVRNTPNLWAVGDRMALMVRRGAPNWSEYERVMNAIASDAGDCWASFVNFKLNELISKSEFSPEEGDIKDRLMAKERKPKNLEHVLSSEDEEMRALLYPSASELFISLEALIGWKRGLLSSHFSSLLDSLLRLHAFSEVRHLSMANSLLLELALTADEQDYTEVDIRDKFRTLQGRSALSSDADLNDEIDNCASLLERARVFFNEFPDSYGIETKISSISNIADWFLKIRAGDASFKHIKKGFRASFDNGSQAREIKNSPPLKNFKEFLKYVVQQRVVDTGLAGQFDQGYWAQKSGAYRAAPWKMRISPVGSLLFAGLACRGLPSCTFSDISERMKLAGLSVSKTGKSQLHLNLKSLGLTIDSPDGVGGFLVSNPFKKHPLKNIHETE